MKKALVIGVGLVARRKERLLAVQTERPTQFQVSVIDIRNATDVLNRLPELIGTMGGVDLVIIAAGIGYVNPELELEKELETIATNVHGFTAAANVAFQHFLRQGSGHLVGISSIAALRGGADAPAYHASKAYISNYLEGLTQKAVKSHLAIVVTEVQCGFVDTDMAKGEGLFWVAPVHKAAMQICRAIKLRKSHAYITSRWRVVAWLLKSLPTFVYHRT